ncbi:MAG TPA: M20/M25/M40 family metallo-hydrolase [Longimicrobiales bacterium]|nr:M20/M25/M40 family metallo-hydrolase [Longimicrobiales bacterium]
MTRHPRLTLAAGALTVGVLCAACATPSALATQAASGSLYTAQVRDHRAVRDALRWLEDHYEEQVAEWIRITEIPAKSTHEQARGAYIRAQMEASGLEVSVDDLGNVVGIRRGTGGGSTVVFAAHMDTVHPQDTDVSVKRDGDILRAPGIFDNSSSVANMLATIRALNAAGVRTVGDLIFIATVQEEIGLRGMNHWLESNPGVADMLVAIDGGVGSINYGALGIYWTRYTFHAEGSHTNTSTGKPHPVRALSDAVRSIYELRIPEGRGGAVYNAGMVAGGFVFNAIPQDVSFTMDLRSVNPQLLDSLDAEIEARVARAAEANRVRWTMEREQQSPAGGTEETLADRGRHPLVLTAVDVYGELGLGNRTVASGSTDANTGVIRGIPSIAVGRGVGGEQHTLSEWADRASALPATKAIVLLAASLPGVVPALIP